MTKQGTCPTCGQPMPKAVANLRPKEATLLRIICQAQKGMAVSDLAAKAGRSREGAFDRTLTDMRKKGLIVRHEGHVKATSAGRVAAA